jgi:hypothetical protein
MSTIIKLLGWLSIIVSVVLLLAGVVSIVFIGTLLPLAASALLGGAMLIVFARRVELLEELNNKLVPIHSLAVALESHYQPAAATATIDSNDPDHVLWRPPANSRVEQCEGRRIVVWRMAEWLGNCWVGAKKFFLRLRLFDSTLNRR